MSNIFLKEVNYDPSLLYNNLYKGISGWKTLLETYQSEDIVMEYFKDENFHFEDILLAKGLEKYKETNFNILDKFPKIKEKFEVDEIKDTQANTEMVEILRRSALKTFRDFQIGEQPGIFEENFILQIIEHAQILNINPVLLKDIIEQNIQYCLLDNFNKEKIEVLLRQNYKNNDNLEEEQIQQQINNIINSFFYYNLLQKLNIFLKQNSINIFKDFCQQIEGIFRLPLKYEHIYNQKSFTIYKEKNELRLVYSNNLKENVTYIKIKKTFDRIDRFLHLDDRKLKQILNEQRPQQIIIVADENITLSELKSLHDQLRCYQKYIEFDLNIVNNEIINEIYKKSQEFTSKQNFFNMYFLNPIDITILRYKKSMLNNIDQPIDEDFLDYLITNFLRYKFLQRGIIFDYLRSKDYVTTLNCVIDKNDVDLILDTNHQGITKIELKDKQQKYFYFYKVLNQDCMFNVIKYYPKEVKIAQQVENYLRQINKSYVSYLFEGMMSEMFYDKESKSHLHFFIEMVKKLLQGTVLGEDIVKKYIARFFLDLFQFRQKNYKRSLYEHYILNQFFDKLIKQQNLEMNLHEVIEIKIIEVQDHFVKGYYKDTYAVYLSQKDCGLSRQFKMYDFYSKNEYIQGNIIEIDKQYLELDIAQNIQDRDIIVENIQKLIYQKYQLQDYQYILTPKYIKLAQRLFLQKRNHDFLEINHDKYFNKPVQIIKEKLIKDQSDDKIKYFFLPAIRDKKYQLQAQIYIKDIEQFITVPIFYDNKQKENFDQNLIDLELEEKRDHYNSYYINKFEKYKNFDNFVDYFKEVSENILKVIQNQNFTQSIESGDKEIEYRFKNDNYFYIEVVYEKKSKLYESEIQMGVKFYFKDQEFSNLLDVQKFIEQHKNKFQDEKHISKIIEIQNLSECENQIDIISNVNSLDTNSIYRQNNSNIRNRKNQKFQKHDSFNSSQSKILKDICESKKSDKLNNSDQQEKQKNNRRQNVGWANNKKTYNNQKQDNPTQDDNRGNVERRSNKRGWGNNNKQDNPPQDDNKDNFERRSNKGGWGNNNKQDNPTQDDNRGNVERRLNKGGWGNNDNRQDKQKKSWSNNNQNQYNKDDSNNDRQNDQKQQQNKQNRWNKNNDSDSNKNQSVTRKNRNTGWGGSQKNIGNDQKSNQKRSSNSGWSKPRFEKDDKQEQKQKPSWQNNKTYSNKNNISKQNSNESEQEQKNSPQQKSTDNKSSWQSRPRKQASWGLSKQQNKQTSSRNVVWQSKTNTQTQIKEKKEEFEESKQLKKKSQI